MANLNYCTFIGNAGDVPYVKTFQNGKVAMVNIAVTEKYTDRDGNRKEATEWIPLVFSDKLADVAEKYIEKGTPIFVAGKFVTRSWTSADEIKQYRTEIRVRDLQLLGGRRSEEKPAPAPAPAPTPVAAPANVPPPPVSDDLPW